MIGRHPLSAYFVLACAISWLVWLPRIASEQDWWSREVPPGWHYAGAVGPVLAALLVSRIADGPAGPRALLRQYDPRRVPIGWLAATLGGLVGCMLLAVVAARLVDGTWLSVDAIGRTADLPQLGLPGVFLLHFWTFGIGEETGWRGFALPRLQETRTAGHATALLLVGWATWHIPAFFESSGLQGMNGFTIVGWLVALAFGAVFLTWLYNTVSGSLLALTGWHALFNTCVASDAADGIIAAVVSAGVILAGFTAARLAGTAELRGLRPDSGPRVRWSDLRRPRPESP